jgi:hypothetical protein
VAIGAVKLQSVTSGLALSPQRSRVRVSSSPPFFSLTGKEWQRHTISNPKPNPKHTLSRFFSTFSELDRLEVLALSLDLPAIHGVYVARSGLWLRMAKQALDHRELNLVRTKESRQTVPQIVPTESGLIIAGDHARRYRGRTLVMLSTSTSPGGAISKNRS